MTDQAPTMSRSSSVHKLIKSSSKSVIDVSDSQLDPLDSSGTAGMVSEGNRRRAEMLHKLK